MSVKTIRAAMAIPLEGASVEGRPPTAFRIWRAGENPTDRGVHLFTERSAAALLALQAERANDVSIDVDHLSLSETAPPESRKAVGWHRLEVRNDAEGKPELWATNVRWTDAVAAGFTKDPPEWKYFSPAYDVDTETGEITRYLNTALTNNPATWRVTALASARASSSEEAMDLKKEDVLAGLKKMAEGEDEDEAKCAKAALAAFEPGEGRTGEGEAGEKKDDEEEPAEKKDDAADEEEPAEKKDEPKKDTAVAATASTDVELAKTVVSMSARLDEIERRDRKSRRASILASRPDLPEALRATLSKSKLETVERIVASIPKPKGKNLAAAQQASVDAGATRGKDQGKGSASGGDPKTVETINARMGLGKKKDAIAFKNNVLTLGTVDASEARERIKARSAGKVA